jgi:hypothetical protein
MPRTVTVAVERVFNHIVRYFRLKYFSCSCSLFIGHSYRNLTSLYADFGKLPKFVVLPWVSISSGEVAQITGGCKNKITNAITTRKDIAEALQVVIGIYLFHILPL